MPGNYSESGAGREDAIEIKLALFEEANCKLFTFSGNARASGPPWPVRFRIPRLTTGLSLTNRTTISGRDFGVHFGSPDASHQRAAAIVVCGHRDS